MWCSVRFPLRLYCCPFCFSLPLSVRASLALAAIGRKFYPSLLLSIPGWEQMRPSVLTAVATVSVVPRLFVRARLISRKHWHDYLITVPVMGPPYPVLFAATG